MLRHYIHPGHYFAIAEANGEVVGRGALVHEAEGVARIRRMAVRPDCRGVGLGQRYRPLPSLRLPGDLPRPRIHPYVAQPA